jgi:hypothetical protein
LWNTAFVHWELGGKVAAQPLKRAEVLAFQKRRQRSPLKTACARFLSFASAELSLSAEETEALYALAVFAQEKLEEVLAVDAETVDLRFIEGVLVKE